MIRAVFRLLAMLALAIAVIMAVLDATRTVAAKTLVTTPLLLSWQGTWPNSLETFQAFVEQKLASFLWNPLMTTMLSLPGFVVFALLALLLYAIGHKRERRTGLAFGE